MNKRPRLSRSGIEYLDYIWSFYSGCLNWKKGICQVEKCWAKSITERFKYHYPNGFEPTFYPEAFLSPLNLKKPSRIGVAFMGDLFGDWIDPGKMINVPMVPGLSHAEPLREQVFRTINQCPQHSFLFLTKCPQNLVKWSPFPGNCQVGVTAVNSETFASACLYLRAVEAKLKYLSIEPYLGMIINTKMTQMILELAGINSLIIGAQTKPYKPPKIEWVREIVEACDKAGIAVFLKENLRPILPPEVPTFYYLATPFDEIDQRPTLRQEVPHD